MAKSALAAQLDALMGKERNVPVALRTNKKVRFFDHEIDKHWLTGCSPHILFKNSRSDLGPWEFVEDDEAKVEWDGLSQEKKDEWGFENDLMEYLRGLVDKLDGQIKRAKEKLLADQSGRLTLSKETQAQVDQMAAQIKELQEEANTLGESGEVDESMKKMAEVEAIKVKKEALENPTFPGKEKIMEVCEICGNYMANTDSEVRKAEHLAGKQHLGWQAIREHLTRLRAMNDGRGPPRRRKDLKDLIKLEAEGGGKEKERGGDKDKDRRDRSKERDKDKDKDRDRKDRSKERDKDKDKERERDRDRDRDRDRGRDKYDDRYKTTDYRERDRGGGKDYRDRDSSRRGDDRRRDRSRERY